MINSIKIKQDEIVYRHLKDKTSNGPFTYHMHFQKSDNKNYDIADEAIIALENNLNAYSDWLSFLAGD